MGWYLRSSCPTGSLPTNVNKYFQVGGGRKIVRISPWNKFCTSKNSTDLEPFYKCKISFQGRFYVLDRISVFTIQYCVNYFPNSNSTYFPTICNFFVSHMSSVFYCNGAGVCRDWCRRNVIISSIRRERVSRRRSLTNTLAEGAWIASPRSIWCRKRLV